MARRFDLTYAVTYLSRFSVPPREGHLDLAKKVFGYLNKYTSQGCVINPQEMTIDVEYEKVELKMDFGNKYSYFQEDIDDRFPEPRFDELDLKVFVDSVHVHDKVTVRSITGLFSVVVSTPMTW